MLWCLLKQPHKGLAPDQTDSVRVHLHDVRFFLNSHFLARPDDSNNKSPGTRYTTRQRRYGGVGASGAASMIGWDDGVVSLSFSNRLQLRQRKQGTQNSEAHPETQSQQQHSRPEKRPQMHVRRQREEEQGAGFQAHRRTLAEKSPAGTQESRAERTTRANSRASSMTKLNASSFNICAQPTPMQPTPSTGETNPAGAVETRTATTKDAPADRKPHLTALSSTNLNALFKTRDNPIAGGASLPAYASTTARVRSALERSAGDYSRFLPRRVGVRKDVSRLSPLRTARHALAVQRDVSLNQRRVALDIIDGLAQPRRPQARI
jgi:hypothetical protein